MARTGWAAWRWERSTLWLSRCWDSRELEYVDAIVASNQSELWSAYADYLARTNAPADATQLQRVTIVVEEALIEPPDEVGWPPMDRPIPRDDAWVAFKRKYASSNPPSPRKAPR